MSLPPETKLERQQIRRAFHQAASRYDQSAVLQQEVAQRLLERLDLLKYQPQRILDLGTGTGQNLTPILERYPKAQLYALDLAEGMLHMARNKLSRWQRFRNKVRFISAAAEQLPLADSSIDMIISGLTLQWCDDLPKVFEEFRRVLSPGGVVMFTTFGPDTLKELRYAWQQVDSDVHIHSFLDMHVIGDAMVRARLAEPVMDMEILTVTYHNVRQIMRDLKDIGAHNVAAGRPRSLMGKQRFQKMVESYEIFRQEERLPVTYEVVYGHAWAPEDKRADSIEVKFTR